MGDKEDKPGNDGGAGDGNVDIVGNNGDEDGGCGNSQILKRSCKVIMQSKYLRKSTLIS